MIKFKTPRPILSRFVLPSSRPKECWAGSGELKLWCRKKHLLWDGAKPGYASEPANVEFRGVRCIKGVGSGRNGCGTVDDGTTASKATTGARGLALGDSSLVIALSIALAIALGFGLGLDRLGPAGGGQLGPWATIWLRIGDELVTAIASCTFVDVASILNSRSNQYDLV
jgi:hypothetical protein